jgi:hypothetical protein
MPATRYPTSVPGQSRKIPDDPGNCKIMCPLSLARHPSGPSTAASLDSGPPPTPTLPTASGGRGKSGCLVAGVSRGSKAA